MPALDQQAPQNVSTTAPAGKGTLLSFLLAILIGLAGIGVIALVVHWAFTQVYAKSNAQLTWNAVTPAAFFLFLLVLWGVNPLLRRFAPSLVLRRRELLLVLAMWLLASATAYENLIAPVLHAVGNAQNADIKQPMTRQMDVISYLRTTPADAPESSTSPAPAATTTTPPSSDLYLSAADAKDYHLGLGGTQRIEFRKLKVKWHLWVKPLCFWVPFMIVAVIFASSLVQVFHRQWSRHELLTYPIAGFADSLLEQDPRRLFPSLLYNRIFWAGFAVTAIIFTMNGLSAWFPQMVSVPLSFSHFDLIREFEFLKKYCGSEAYSLFRGMLYPFVVALAVFLPTEISFSCWAGWILMIITPGISFLLTGDRVVASDVSSIRTGMYIGMLTAILIIGRREYLSILRHAITFRRTEDLSLRRAAMACRVFALAFAAFAAMLTYSGMDWVIAVFLTMSFALVVILLARMTAEMGFPWLVNLRGASKIFPMQFLGPAAIGPKALALLAVMSVILDGDTSNSVAAQETTYRKLEEGSSSVLPRWLFNAVLLLALLATIGFTIFGNLWNNYSYGSQAEPYMRGTLNSSLQTSAVEINRLKIEGTLEASAQTHGLDKLKLMRPESRFARYFLVGAAFIAICSFLRLRFTWWPFHPLPFLFMDTWAMSRLAFSFLIGWMIKSALLKIGGGKFFNGAKPFFFGVIAGQLIVITLWYVIGLIYYAKTGINPPAMPPFI